VKHVAAIAGRDLRSLFVSPVAYATLALFSLLGGFFFFLSVLGFSGQIAELQQIGRFDILRQLNLNDHLIAPFYGIMWIVILFLVPGITMGLFASEKANGTQELLMTSPITIWELVIGKFLAAAVFVLLLVGIVGLYTGIVFLYGDPEVPKTLSGLLGLGLVALSYAAVGVFASSVTRNQLIAFFLALVLLLVLWMLSIVADLGAAGGAIATNSGLSDMLRWLSSADRFEQMLRGLVDTKDLTYFAFMIGVFLLLTKAAVESVRWR
jgi:ABC-2 type transport system permease protein